MSRVKPDETKIEIVGVDAGKNMTKAVLRENGKVKSRFSIRTTMSPTIETKSQSNATAVVTMNGESTLIGDASAEFDSDTSKAKEVNRRVTYLAVSELVKDGANVALSIGCPLSIYFNHELLTVYKRFMLNMPEGDLRNPDEVEMSISLEVNGEKRSFTIKHLFVLPETSGHLIKEEEKYLGREVAVVDIGGLNVNGAVYQTISRFVDGGEIELLDIHKGTFFTIDDGGNIFKTKLQDELNSKYDAGIKGSQMDRIIKDGYIKINPEESAKIINMFKSNFFNTIKHRMKLRGWSTSTLDFVFVGGGSLLFAEDIKKDRDFADAIISSNAVWDNVEGFAQAVEDALYQEVV